MPLPRWLARTNRRFLNPRIVGRGSWPVLVHEGRTSGRTHRTPLGAYPVEDGYLFTLNYGTRSDWARNALVAGGAQLEIGGTTIDLTEPRLLSMDEAHPLLPDDAELPPSFVGVQECLVMTAQHPSANPASP